VLDPNAPDRSPWAHLFTASGVRFVATLLGVVLVYASVVGLFDTQNRLLEAFRILAS
jgi:hypothetical protein